MVSQLLVSSVSLSSQGLPSGNNLAWFSMNISSIGLASWTSDSQTAYLCLWHGSFSFSSGSSLGRSSSNMDSISSDARGGSYVNLTSWALTDPMACKMLDAASTTVLSPSEELQLEMKASTSSCSLLNCSYLA
uniref:Uncharacterized protein n=1 Tax=Arundo donax TaxID=35708 RepID=A0A0A9EYX6_ARUDO